MNQWRTIWSRRGGSLTERLELSDLLRLDGYDVGAGAIAPDIWQNYVHRRAEELGLRAGDSVFEVGCGAGAFLWVLRQRGCRVSGLDYSQPLITAARQAMPDSDWRVGEARQPLGDAAYDVTLAQSVFHYFPTHDYAAAVLQHMLRAARRAVGILDIPDTALITQAEAHRKDLLGDAEYARRYAGLHHLAFTPGWFREQASADWAVTVTPQDIPEFGNNAYRFNVILTHGAD